MSFKHTKKIIVGFASLIVVGLFFQPVRAQAALDMSAILAAIKEDTGKILIAVDSLPSRIDAIAKEIEVFYMAFNKADDAKDSPSVTLQADFANLYNLNTANAAARKSLQEKLVAAYLVTNFATRDASGLPQKDKNGSYNIVPVSNINSIVYQALLGIPIKVTGDPFASTDNNLNFIVNASGTNTYHTSPKDNWRGSTQNILNYRNYYNSINAIQTYDSYVLSRLADDFAKPDGGSLSDLQSKLMEDASSSGWFTKVASEDIGIVLRQILMYNSQTYVLLVHMLQVQKEQLAVATMTNTLFIWANNFTEGQLLDKAQK